MLEKSVQGFSNFSVFDQVVIVTTEGHLEGINPATITNSLTEMTGVGCSFFTLGAQTESVIDTLTGYLEALDQDVPFIVKDCDNFVAVDSNRLAEERNAVVYGNLHDFPKVSAPSKSFIELGVSDTVENFVEKRVISSFFSVGVTKFESASSFMAGSKMLGGGSQSESYVSDVVRSLMQLGASFRGIQTGNYEDWGTLEGWQEMSRQYATLFIDVDGVIVMNASRVSDSQDWSSFSPIENNVAELLRLQAAGTVTMIFTTSRSEQYRAVVEEKLLEIGFQSPQIVMGLPHAQRILVNDFSPTNPYPSASAVSLERDSNNLAQYIRNLLRID